MNKNTALYSGTAVLFGLTCFSQMSVGVAAGDLSTVDAATRENYYQWSSPDAYSLGSGNTYGSEPTSPSNNVTSTTSSGAAIPASTYTVQPSETLFAVVRQTGVPLQQLIQLNDLQPPYPVKAGQKLRLNGAANITSPTPNIAVLPPVPGATYTVKAGETLYQVMRQTGVHVKQLVKLNNLKQPYHVKAGQVLKTGK